MKTVRGRAILLSRRSFLENDALIEVFSESEGRISLLSKGVKKMTSRQCGVLQPFCVVEYERIVPRGERTLSRLIRVSLIRENAQKESSSLLFFAYCVAAEITLRFSCENHSVPRIFALWEEFLSEKTEVSMGLFGFLCRFFSILGMFPDFSLSGASGEKLCLENTFSWDFSSGILEGDSAAGERITLSLLKTFSFASRAHLSDTGKIVPTSVQEQQVFQMLEKFIQSHTPFPLRSWHIYQDSLRNATEKRSSTAGMEAI